jgi:hypothetical protein
MVGGVLVVFWGLTGDGWGVKNVKNRKIGFSSKMVKID